MQEPRLKLLEELLVDFAGLPKASLAPKRAGTGELVGLNPLE